MDKNNWQSISENNHVGDLPGEELETPVIEMLKN